MKKRMTLILALGMLNFAHTAMAGELALGQVNSVSDYQPQSMACHGVSGEKKASSLRSDKVSGKKTSAEKL